MITPIMAVMPFIQASRKSTYAATAWPRKSNAPAASWRGAGGVAAGVGSLKALNSLSSLYERFRSRLQRQALIAPRRARIEAQQELADGADGRLGREA